MPRSVLRVVPAARDVIAHTLPVAIARARTHLVWREDEQSAALTALLAEVARGGR